MLEVLSIKDFRRAQGMRAIGSAIVTAETEDGPAGFLAFSATHLTASPSIMSVAVMPTTSSLGVIRKAGAFAINYLAEQGGQAILDRFAGGDASKGAARFDGLELGRMATGAPILPGNLGAMDCRLEQEQVAFGTLLLFGRIEAVTQDTAQRSLVHFAGGTSTLSKT
ncbi:MAG: flavin reductase [Mameliella sp.]|nr:flavin reductase [Mameliella sp.]